MAAKLYNGISASEMKQMLKELRVKTSKSQYDNDEHFDFNTSGKYIASLDNKEVIKGQVMRALDMSPSVLRQLKFIELTNPLYMITENATADDFSVRVFGSLNESKNFVQWQWQILDFSSDINKLWDKKCVSKVNVVQAQKDLAETTAKLFKLVKITDMAQDQLGCIIKLDAAIAPILNYVTGTPNVAEWKAYADGSILLRFNFPNKYCSLCFSNGTIITFVLKESRTGIMGEKPKLYQGAFDGRNYYQKVIEK